MRNFFVFSVLFLSINVSAQSRWNQTYQQYIDQYKDVAIKQMKEYKIPASIILAQGLLESAAGTSELTRKGNNHFGIKCHGWTGRSVYHDDDMRNECFRAYDSAYESFVDHSKFLTGRQRYSSLFQLDITDYKGWAHGLKAAGYATNPKYASQLINIIQLYKLYEYDKAKDYDHFKSDRTKDQPVNGDLHAIWSFNKNYYVIARRGDTFKTIGKEIGIDHNKIASFNERSSSDRLEEGEYIWLKKKQKKAPKDYKGRLHYVKAGESMYTIAQKYGILVKSLYKMNHLGPDYDLKVGDKLRLR
jgi:LysM repeat protein